MDIGVRQHQRSQEGRWFDTDVETLRRAQARRAIVREPHANGRCAELRIGRRPRKCSAARADGCAARRIQKRNTERAFVSANNAEHRCQAQSAPGELGREVKLIPLTSIAVTALIWLAILAGILAMRDLRVLAARHPSFDASHVQGRALTRRVGLTIPAFVPVAFLVTWLLLLVKSSFTREALSHAGAREFFNSVIALGRVGVPEDIAGVVSFLCSKEGRCVNAQRVEASGGMFL